MSAIGPDRGGRAGDVGSMAAGGAPVASGSVVCGLTRADHRKRGRRPGGVVDVT
jgi:hypothetical protein